MRCQLNVLSLRVHAEDWGDEDMLLFVYVLCIPLAGCVAVHGCLFAAQRALACVCVCVDIKSKIKIFSIR